MLRSGRSFGGAATDRVQSIIQAVLAAAQAAWPGASLALILYGSAHRGDFVPFCSDLNLRLILPHDCFDPSGALDPKRALFVRRILEGVELAPFRALSIDVWDSYEFEGRIFVPGSFRVVHGQAELHDPDVRQMLVEARLKLAKLPERLAYHARKLLQLEREGLMQQLAELAQDVTRALRFLWALENNAPLESWRRHRLEIASSLCDRELAEASIGFLEENAALFQKQRSDAASQLKVVRLGLQLLLRVHEAARATTEKGQVSEKIHSDSGGLGLGCD